MGRSIVFWLLGAGMTLGMFATGACGNEGGGASATADPCPLGICGSGGAGAGGTSTSGTGGSAGAASSSSGGSCTEAWLCTPWDTGGSGDAATRTCTDTNACGTTASKPAETATLPALDFGYFKCNIEPILDAKCSMVGCHGTESGRALRVYARGRLRHAGETLVDPLLCAGQASTDSCNGSISCPCTAKHTDIEWRRNYDTARGFALDDQGKPIAAGMEATSELIAQPVVGGKAHAGIHLFKSGDADDMALRTWLASAGKTTSCDPGFN